MLLHFSSRFKLRISTQNQGSSWILEIALSGVPAPKTFGVETSGDVICFLLHSGRQAVKIICENSTAL